MVLLKQGMSVDTDRHDAVVFNLPNSHSREKVHSSSKLTGETGGERLRAAKW